MIASLVAVCAVFLPAPAFDSTSWIAGKVGRVVVNGGEFGLLATSEASGRRLATLARKVDYDEAPTRAVVKSGLAVEIASGTVRFVSAGLRVGILKVYSIDVTDPSMPGGKNVETFAKVRVQSGPLKGKEFYTAWVYFADEFVFGEPVFVSSGRKLTPAAFGEDELAQFVDAMNAKDTGTEEGLLASKRVIGLTDGTLGYVDPDLRSGIGVRVRIRSGLHRGSLIYVIRDHVHLAY